MPLIELLLLLPLLLRTALLYGRRRPHQRMRFLRNRSRLLRLRWTEIAVRRLRITILLWLRRSDSRAACSGSPVAHFPAVRRYAAASAAFAASDVRCSVE